MPAQRAGPSRVTLADVARACGTSASTVSRALSAPDKVSRRTRERILRAARELGYQPHQAARSLSLGRTATLGLVVPDIANPFFPPIVKAVQARAGDKQHAVLLADTDENAADELPRARVMRRQVDGLIVASPRTAEDQLGAFLQLGPVVFVNRQVAGAPSVSIENSQGIDQAVEHLAALRHGRIAYLGGPRRSWSNLQRRLAVIDACARHGVELVEFGPFEPQLQAGARAADLVQASGVTAVIAYDDLIALGVMTRLSERQLRIGHDVSVVGIDDAVLASLCYPTLTSIHVPGAKAGAVAVDLLLDQLDGRAPATTCVSLETHLVVRGSTGPAPGR